MLVLLGDVSYEQPGQRLMNGVYGATKQEGLSLSTACEVVAKPEGYVEPDPKVVNYLVIHRGSAEERVKVGSPVLAKLCRVSVKLV